MQRNREAEKQERQTGKEAERQTVCLRPTRQTEYRDRDKETHREARQHQAKPRT